MDKKIVSIIGILFIATCCTTKVNQENGYGATIDSRDFEFVKVDSKSFPLDATTAGGGNNFQYIEDEGKKLFCYLNKNQNTLIFYDYEKETLDSKLRMERSGPNGVGEINGFMVHSLDSIFVYSYKGAWLYLLNQFGKISEMYDFKTIENASLTRPNVSGYQPMMKIGDQIILNNWGAQREYYKNDVYPEGLLVNVNLQNKEMDYTFSYPEVYTKGIWGIQLHVMYNVLNPVTSEIILGFPIDDHIYVLRDGDVKNFLQRSKYFKGVNPLSTKSKISPPPIKQEVQKELGQTTYRTIHYDPYNDIYLRVVHKAINEEVLAMNDPVKSIFPKASLFIMDNEFKRIGEVDFDDNNYWINNIFINENGIHIMKMDFVNEDILTFDIFEINQFN
jgi:hypothetical protein